MNPIGVTFPEAVRLWSDDALLELVRATGELRQQVDARAAVLAGELARRSAPTLGHDGLAQRSGHRTPEKLIQSITGSPARDAVQAVRVGSLAQTHPWLAHVSQAVGVGAISTDAAEAIRSGLGSPSSDIPATVLRDAAAGLLADAVEVDADLLFKRARFTRDQLDAAGVIDRERAAREAREFRLFKLRDGSVRISWFLDAIEGSVVAEVYDRATSPKRGGPRFVTEEEQVARIADDPRSLEQLASDVFFHLLTAGAEVAPDQLLGQGAPAVRVMVTARDLTSRTGSGFLAGTHQAVSIATVERLACTNGIMSISFDDHGRPLDVGRDQRLFTRRQRIALDCRDGGCRWGDCERPASWCEAHHITPWHHGGRTDVADGIQLCKHHHLLLHDHGWHIERRGEYREQYWLIPPPGHPERERPLISKSPAHARLLAAGV